MKKIKCLCSTPNSADCTDDHCLCRDHFLKRKDWIEHLIRELTRVAPRPKSLVRKLLNEIIK